MKLSSISRIATALAAIAGCTTAAPAPRPFDRDVDIYSRTDRVFQSVIAGIATDIHSKACDLNRSARDCARAAGLHTLAKYHSSRAKWNLKKFRAHHSGTAEASTVAPGLKSQRLALGTMDHKDAADLSQKAADRAEQVGWHELAKFHRDEVKAHHEHMESLRHDPDHANNSRELAHTTPLKVDHMESALLNQQAAHLAGHRGLRMLAKDHDDRANQNIQFIYSDIQDPQYAHATKAKALETLGSI